MLSQAIQDYLKVIYNLQEDNDTVSTTAIAKELNISGASVTGMLKRLSTMRLVKYHSYKGVKLSKSGRKFALEIIRNHRILELFLKEQMGFSLEKVHEEACRLEHYISNDFLKRADELLGHPKFDPHGHPIPNKDGSLPLTSETPLSDVDPGKEVKISRLADSDFDMLAYFEKLGLIPNVKVSVIEKAPFRGPITINFGGDNQIIGNEIAKNIFVEREN